MNANELRALQAPFKERYRREPASALGTVRARGEVDVSSVSCAILRQGPPPAAFGLHPMAGGAPDAACPAETLLEALVGCAGVTFAAVCTAMEIPIQKAILQAEGDLDFRGTLGVDREVPIGFQEIRLTFELQSEAPDAKLAKAVELAERYCVVAQSLKSSAVAWRRLP